MSKLSSVQFSASVIDHPRGIHSIKAKKGDTEVGRLYWHQKGGTIEHIEVYPEHQRQGIATAMFNEANRVAKERNVSAPTHSRKRTEEGEAWAKTVGGDLPKRTFCKVCDSPRHSASQCPEVAAQE